jgi:hypothetical protein
MARPGKAGTEESFPGSDYTDDELEFLRAVDRLKRTCRFPSCRDILRLIATLGYRKVATGEAGKDGGP